MEAPTLEGHVRIRRVVLQPLETMSTNEASCSLVVVSRVFPAIAQAALHLDLDSLAHISPPWRVGIPGLDSFDTSERSRIPFEKDHPGSILLLLCLNHRLRSESEFGVSQRHFL